MDLVAFFSEAPRGTADVGFLAAAFDVFFFAASSLIGEAVSNIGEILITPHNIFRQSELLLVRCAAKDYTM